MGLIALVTVWIPFHSHREFLNTRNLEILRSSFMNVALFCPAGILSAVIMPDRRNPLRKLVPIAILFDKFSLSIKVVQYVRVLGNAEIYNVIHNTLGALLGSLAVCSRSESIPKEKERTFL